MNLVRMLINSLSFIMLFIAPCMMSCAIKPHSGTKSGSEFSKFESQPLSHSIPEYRLGYGDVIEVKFFNNNQFNETLTVRPDGRISMQKVGDIQVAGMTPNELSKSITDTYARIIINPEVTVIVRNFGGYQVYVLGEVKTPGAFPVQKNMTMLQALALAGGQKETAKLKSVLLMRRNLEGMMEASRIDLSGSNPESIKTNDTYVAAFDIIYVPKTFIANVNTFLEQAFSGVIQPLDVYLRAAYWGRW